MLGTRRKTLSKASGFTLIELVMVIILLAILGGTAGPALFNSRNYQERISFDQVVAALRYANKYATVTSCDVEVSFSNSSAGNTLNLYQRDNCSTAPAGSNTGGFSGTSITQPSWNLNSDSIVIPTQVSVTTSGVPFYFNPLGQAANVSTKAVISTATIQIGTLTMTIIGGTGYVSD